MNEWISTERLVLCFIFEKKQNGWIKPTDLRISGHFISKLSIFAHEVDGEGVMVLPPEHVGSTRLPQEGVARGHADGVPEIHYVNTTPLGWNIFVQLN